MLFRQIFDRKLAQYAYLIGCQKTGEALIVDPERDIDQYLDAAEAEGLRITAVAETHIHADFLSGARAFAAQGATVYLSDEGDEDWKYAWADEEGYDVRLLKDGDTFHVGNIALKAVHTPGHTPEHLSYLLTDHGGGADAPMGLLSGDFVFVGDVGRPDLLESAAGQEGAMAPAAKQLYASLQAFLTLDDALQVWPGHGAGSACGKALGAVPQTTVGYERRFNAAIDTAQQAEAAFIDEILSGQPEPPLYFARMKHLNKTGPALLDGLPQPEHLAAEAFATRAGQDGAVVLDTRADRSVFMQRHLPGALYTPFNKQFNTTAGSYADPDWDLYLVIDEADVEEAVRDLVRVGLDRVKGFITPAEQEAFFQNGGAAQTVEEIDFEGVARLRGDDTVVLDVRRQAEYEAAHLDGALNIAHTRLADRLDEVPRDKTVLVHCLSGARSAVASALLARRGFDVRYVNDQVTRGLALMKEDVVA